VGFPASIHPSIHMPGSPISIALATMDFLLGLAVRLTAWYMAWISPLHLIFQHQSTELTESSSEADGVLQRMMAQLLRQVADLLGQETVGVLLDRVGVKKCVKTCVAGLCASTAAAVLTCTGNNTPSEIPYYGRSPPVYPSRKLLLDLARLACKALAGLDFHVYLPLSSVRLD